MKILSVSALFLSLTVLSGCALTPAEQAAQAKERAQQLLATQIKLAEQCDPQTAALMRQMPTADQLPPAQRNAFDKDYTAHINNPTFQACYNMAWKTYRQQNQLEIERMQAWDENNTLDWNNGIFFDSPFGFNNFGGFGPY